MCGSPAGAGQAIRPLKINYIRMKNLVSEFQVSGKFQLYRSLMVIIGLTALIVFTSGNPVSKSGMKIYISTTGNDRWSGRLSQSNHDKTDGPFATISRARDEIRKLKENKKLPEGSIVIEIQEGSYELPDAIELGPKDGGKDSLSRIIYLGKKGRVVRLTGGKRLTKWQLVTEKDVLGKLRPEVRDKIYQTDLSAAGIKEFGSLAGSGTELFFNDKPMKISRYPNKGFVKITGLLNIDPVDVRGTKGDKAGKFIYDDRRISLWKNEKDAWVQGYWFWDWSEERQKVASIDTVKRIIELEPPYHRYGYRTGQWFFGLNLISEIDEPGEYYIDRERGILYFYPPSDIEKGHAYVSVTKNIFNMNNVSFLTIEGVILEGCRETAVIMKDCNYCSVAGCSVRNAGDWAVTINGGIRDGVKSCDIYDTGAGGIYIQAGDRNTLVPAGCYADNNYIHHTARIKRIYNPCISLYGVGNRVTHNLMAHVPHMAIYFSGNDHLMEYNEIGDVCYESNDAGAIYAGRDWTMRGNIIRYNYLHDISGFEKKGCVGIYLDDAFSSADITGNIFNRVTRAAMIGGGRDNSIVNNIFIGCTPSLHVDARGIGWMENEHIPDWMKEAEEKGTILGIAYNRPPYSTRYPALANILNDEPKAPKGNVISLNICVGGNWDKPSGFWNTAVEKKARPYLTMENNFISSDSEVEDSTSKSIIIADPLFVNPKDPEKGKFLLRNDSPALKAGFKQIPFEKIGLYKSDDRASWPVQ